MDDRKIARVPSGRIRVVLSDEDKARLVTQEKKAQEKPKKGNGDGRSD